LSINAFAARKALVVGNSTYTEAKLNNTVNDARDIATQLSELGFETILKTNLDKESFEMEIDNFANQLAPQDDAVFYYAGHGTQIEGINYLIPVRAKIENEIQCKHRAVNCNYILEAMQRASVSIVILDACRNNPFAWKRSVSRGLAPMEGKPGNQYIIFSTAAGLEADDGSALNSPFTTALKKHIQTPNITIEDMMRDVVKEVEKLTSGRQVPAAYGNLKERFYFKHTGDNKPTYSAPIEQTPKTTQPKKNTPVPRPPREETNEENSANLILTSNATADVYLNDLFRDKIRAGADVQISGLQPGDYNITLRAALKSETQQVTISSNETQHLSFEIDNTLPGFVFVEGGNFQMGMSGGSRDEKPVHHVTLSPFYISEYESTQKEWVDIMGYNPSSQIDDALPVDNVSWYEAIVYCNKRSIAESLTPVHTILGTTDPSRWGAIPNSTNSNWTFVRYDFYANGYRLPTEAEWEFAARGGMQSKGFKYSGSDDLETVAWNSTNSNKKMQEPGTKEQNELGIYDMSGNVLEWCWDWYDENYYSQSSSQDPKGATSGFSRVLRGGSCNAYMSSNFRVSYRHFHKPEGKKPTYGFRLVRCIQLI